jgi:hypothetical protein
VWAEGAPESKIDRRLCSAGKQMSDFGMETSDIASQKQKKSKTQSSAGKVMSVR